MKNTSINLDTDVHVNAMVYCKEHGYVLGRLVNKLLKDKMKDDPHDRR